MRSVRPWLTRHAGVVAFGALVCSALLDEFRLYHLGVITAFTFTFQSLCCVSALSVFAVNQLLVNANLDALDAILSLRKERRRDPQD